MDVQTTKPQEELFFKERADTFQLSVTLVGEQKLIITMKDFVEWIIYSKEYTRMDIGKEIHQKMDVMDVYTAFAQTKPQCCDEESMKEISHQGEQLKKYEFGAVLMNGSEPCYKIEKGGRITAYLSILDKKIKKDVTYESKLILEKVRNMTETQVSTERSTIEKNLIFQQLSREIQKQEKEKQELVKRVTKLQEENERQREEAVQIREELRIMKEELMVKNAEQEQKFNLAKQTLEIGFNSVKEELVARNQQLQQQLHSTIQQLNSTKSELQARIQSTNQGLNSTKLELDGKLEMQNQRSLNKFAEIEQTLKPIRDMAKLMSLPQAYSNQFKVDWFKVQYTGTDTTWTQFIFNHPINHNQTASFKIKNHQNNTKQDHHGGCG